MLENSAPGPSERKEAPSQFVFKNLFNEYSRGINLKFQFPGPSTSDPDKFLTMSDLIQWPSSISLDYRKK
jgi:hypothetical protein